MADRWFHAIKNYDIGMCFVFNIMTRTSYIWWDDNDVRFVLTNTLNLPKQQSACRRVAPLCFDSGQTSLCSFFLMPCPFMLLIIKDLTRGGWNPINLLNPATLLCLYEQCHMWSFQWVQLRWEVIVRFGGIDGHYCLNFIFITTEKMNFNFYQVVASSVFVRSVVFISGGLCIW
jgi:hypothetical protein